MDDRTGAALNQADQPFRSGQHLRRQIQLRIPAQSLWVAESIETFMVTQHQRSQVLSATFDIAQQTLPDDRMADEMAPLLGLQGLVTQQIVWLQIELADVVQQAGARQQLLACDVTG